MAVFGILRRASPSLWMSRGQYLPAHRLLNPSQMGGQAVFYMLNNDIKLGTVPKVQRRQQKEIHDHFLTDPPPRPLKRKLVVR